MFVWANVHFSLLLILLGFRREKSNNMTWDLEANSYKIFDPTRKRGTVDIPVELRSMDNYRASLAHKTNHSFIPNCEFDEFHHPRFLLTMIN